VVTDGIDCLSVLRQSESSTDPMNEPEKDQQSNDPEPLTISEFHCSTDHPV